MPLTSWAGQPSIGRTKKKILHQIAVIATATSFCVKPSEANPAILAPVALCAGTAGVGCILIGTALIGGGIYYIWQMSDGRRVAADATGSVFKTEYLEDPEEENQETVIALNAKSWQAAKRVCAWHFYGQKLKVFL